MSESPPKKKKKRTPGGSFCAMGGCSNTSARDTTSSIPNRGFIRYLYLPKDPKKRQTWLKRSKRDTKQWKHTANTRICSDHFFEDDFRDDDISRFRSGEKVRYIRLKDDSIPNTDRLTGRFADPLNPPEERYRPTPYNDDLNGSNLNETEDSPGPSGYYMMREEDTAREEDTVMVDQVITEPEDESEYDEDESSCGLDDSDDNGDSESFVDADSDQEFELETEFRDGDIEESEPINHESVNSFLQSANWLFVSVPLLLALFKHCPECGVSARVTKVMTHGFATVIHYRCYGINPHVNVWRSSNMVRNKYTCNMVISAASMMCSISYSALESLMTCLSIPYVGKTTFYRLIATYLYPGVVNKWSALRTMIINSFQGKVDVSGDGHFDSPGWCAKFCTYSIMEIKSGAILDFFICQKGMYKPC